MYLKTIVFVSVLLISGIAWCASRKSMLKVGMQAPDFQLPDELNHIRSLQEFKGKKVVLYFYPKDNTPGCTAQACSMRDSFSVFSENNIVILGISYDKPEKHVAFKKQHHLPFPLLSDTTGSVAHMYESDKGFLGYFVPNRNTFLINEDGIIVAVLKGVDVSTHTAQILKIFNINQ